MSGDYIAERNCCRKIKKKANVDIAVIPETKKKLKSTQDLEDYTCILLYSDFLTNKRAAAGVAIIPN